MSTDKTSSGTATVIGIAIAFSIYGALIRVLLRLGEASPLCTDASLLSRALAIYADVGALVILPLAIGRVANIRRFHAAPSGAGWGLRCCC
jgi:hypothetical protein